MNFCKQCGVECRENKYCSGKCSVKFNHAKRLVSLGYVRNKPKQDYYCAWCNVLLTGQQRKFCCQEHAFKWQVKNKPEQSRKAVRKYWKVHKEEIKAREKLKKWSKIGFTCYEDFKASELLRNKTCATCGSIFHSAYPDQKYCGDDCRPKIKRKPTEEQKKRAREKFKALPKNHPQKLRLFFSNSINQALRARGNKKSSVSAKLLGCTIQELREHIESKFKKGMTWQNKGKYGWHIDHIRPCASFDLSKPEEQAKCFHWTNLQPLWWHENIRKSDSWDGQIGFEAEIFRPQSAT